MLAKLYDWAVRLKKPLVLDGMRWEYLLMTVRLR